MRFVDLRDEHDISHEFRAFIRESSFPCVGAKSALARDGIKIVLARDIRSSWDDLLVFAQLSAFANAYKGDPVPFKSFVIIYEEPNFLAEEEFERFLWQRIQSFSDKDSLFGADFDPRVASDPEDREFSLSFGGEAFFVVGMHPGASRPARRFSRPALVFNLHNQFELLRRQGRYEKMKDTITERDIALAGNSNPMLKRYGDSSEATQYSGRKVSDDWKCPFERREYTWAGNKLA